VDWVKRVSSFQLSFYYPSEDKGQSLPAGSPIQHCALGTNSCYLGLCRTDNEQKISYCTQPCNPNANTCPDSAQCMFDESLLTYVCGWSTVWDNEFQNEQNPGCIISDSNPFILRFDFSLISIIIMYLTRVCLLRRLITSVIKLFFTRNKQAKRRGRFSSHQYIV